MNHYSTLRTYFLATGVPEIKAHVDEVDRAAAAIAALGSRPGGRTQAEMEVASERRDAALQGRPPTKDQSYVNAAVRAQRNYDQQRTALDHAFKARMYQLEKLLKSGIDSAPDPVTPDVRARIKVEMLHVTLEAWAKTPLPDPVPANHWLQTLWTCFGWPPLAEGPAQLVKRAPVAGTWANRHVPDSSLFWPPPINGIAHHGALTFERTSHHQFVRSLGNLPRRKRLSATDTGAVHLPPWKSPGKQPIGRGEATLLRDGSFIWLGGEHGFTVDELDSIGPRPVVIS